MTATIAQQLESVSEHRQAADRLVAGVISRAAAGGAAVSGEIRREALALLKRLTRPDAYPTPIRDDPYPFLRDFIQEFQKILHRYEGVLARVYSDASLAAWLEGGSSVLRHVPPDAWDEPAWKLDWELPEEEPEPKRIVRFDIIEEAVRDMGKRRILTRDRFDQESLQSRASAFQATRETVLDGLDKVQDAMFHAVADGDSLSTFRDRIDAGIGASGLSPHAQEMIFRNALQFRYARGQKAVVEHASVRSSAVFAWRSEIDDSRLTELCRALSHSGIQGTSIFCVDDPVWKKVASPSHTNCRCGAIFLTVKRAAEKGIRVARKWLETGLRPSNDELFVPAPDLSAVPEHERAAFANWVSPWASDSVAAPWAA